MDKNYKIKRLCPTCSNVLLREPEYYDQLEEEHRALLDCVQYFSIGEMTVEEVVRKSNYVLEELWIRKRY